ncbi:MAG: YkgJ family cysteine cluster protein [Bdellovibrionaceae bacterium]|nr:YkgJ family cysteine cluster protein [Pseudobdellovibrionaceae bacterium]
MEKVDVDRPSTWRAHRPGLCQGCWGSCCTMPVEVRIDDLVRLGLVSEDEARGSLKKVAKRLIREKIIVSYRQSSGLFMLASKPNRDCIFLNSETRRCTVYEKRPNVCREFPSIGPRPGWCPAMAKKL